ncbi:YihY/virulence factor BrkB family protein [uncultured Alsobacter sp.]|uniref:YihY/virulence factor BrkB family protein n=1 Tax=uncultured Alsobacter sp. TaxID=1748258 RepID=UPI0025CD3359|nr:YihY/virulence factor BrkB family protein [uncultured Alsobacter sp.]
MPSHRSFRPARPEPRRSLLGNLVLGLGAGLVAWRGEHRRAAGPAQADGTSVAPDGRGRTAARPGQIPARGWQDILWRTWEEMQEDRLVSVAAGVTFYLLLALVPGIAALVSIYGLFADPATIRDHLNSLAGVLPGGAVDVVGEQIGRIAGQGRGTLGTAFVTSLLISLWSANAGTKALFDALNVAYDETEKRSFLRLTLVSLGCTLAAVAFLIVALAGVVVVPLVLDAVGLGTVAEAIIRVARWPLLLVIVAVALAALYRYGPSRDEPRWRWVSVGSAFAALGWLVASLLFSWYAANFGSYNQTYGSLGAVVGFMTWMWISCIVVLLGAELNAETEHQTERDTTDGPAKPLGARGARMADTVGKPAS